MNRIRVYTGGAVAGNGYLFKTGENTYIAIDAPEGFADWIKSKNPKAVITDLLITHQHFDHVQDAARMKEVFGCAIHAGAAYSDQLSLVDMAGKEWNMDIEVPPYEVDDLIDDNKKAATWGGLIWHLYHVPGHSPDSIVYQLPDEDILFSGDTIFAGSIGRTDLPGGNTKLLLKGLENTILSQPLSTTIFPGHGPYTTVRNEKQTNPYLY